MARPVNANAEQTRARILDAASELFAATGFEGASVRQIARGAGVSLGMIRHYFGSKEGLYRACLGVTYAIFEQLGAQIGEGIARGGPADEVVAAAVRRGFRYVLANRAAFKLVLWNLMSEATWRSDLGDERMLPFILAMARGLSGATGRPPGELAIATRSLIFLVVRYGTSDHSEIAYLLSNGVTHSPTETTAQEIEDHLADVARRLFR